MALIDSAEAPADVPTTDALAAKPAQGALVEAAFVRFTGTSHIALDDPPGKREKRVYIVTATCTRIEDGVGKGDEDRLVAVMRIDSCYERGKVPIVDEAQPSLFEDPDPGDDEGKSGIDLSGVDRPAFSDDDYQDAEDQQDDEDEDEDNAEDSGD